MSKLRKLRGGGTSEVTRFKAMWRDDFSPVQRDYWRSQFLSRETQAAIRAELKLKHGISLIYDQQLTDFRDWEFEQRKLDIEAERQGDDERRLQAEHPDWTKDQLREELIKATYRRAKVSGDFKLGLSAMKQDKGFLDVTLSRDEFEFDASAKCLEHLPQILQIRNDKALSQPDKIEAIRKRLWGTPPAPVISPK